MAPLYLFITRLRVDQTCTWHDVGAPPGLAPQEYNGKALGTRKCNRHREC